MLEEQKRMNALFDYETDGGRRALLWREPQYWDSGISGSQSYWQFKERLDEWRKSKRAIERAEVLQGLWVKVGDNGISRVARFLPNGTVEENDLFDGNFRVEGVWELLKPPGVLRMRVQEYELDIFANKHTELHSGIEVVGFSLHAYFRVIHLPNG